MVFIQWIIMNNLTQKFNVWNWVESDCHIYPFLLSDMLSTYIELAFKFKRLDCRYNQAIVRNIDVIRCLIKSPVES